MARQYIFTGADIASKAVYGILLGWVATIRSTTESGVDDPYPNEMAVLTPTKDGIPEGG